MGPVFHDEPQRPLAATGATVYRDGRETLRPASALPSFACASANSFAADDDLDRFVGLLRQLPHGFGETSLPCCH